MIEFIIKNSPTIATLFFFLAFCYIVFSVFKKGTKKKFDNYSKIPLKDDESTKDHGKK
jgi:cbb3-type cytochrome oxidase subunit 3